MAQEPHSQFAPSWFSTLEAGNSLQDSGHQVRAYVRLWRVFMRARVFIALVLLTLQLYMLYNASGNASWLVLMCSLHLASTTRPCLRCPCCWRPSWAP
jgi:two-component system, NtrC family, sensor histidine kinase PilS